MIGKYLVLLGLICLVGFYGCAMKGFQGYQSIDKSPRYESQSLKNYELGKELMAYVGDPVIEVGNLNVVSGKPTMFRSLIDLEQSGVFRGGYQLLKKGQLYPIAGFNASDNSFLISLVKCALGNCVHSYLKVDSEGKIVSRHAVSSLGVDYKPIYFNDYKEGDKLFEMVEDKSIQILDNLFKVQLIYNGKEGNNIKILYREFKDDLARPAFYQSLTYDLSESNIIRYKRHRIEVLRADNEAIVYKVVED